MKFEKSRVYTAVNADELPIGSKCVFADTVKALRKKVQADDYAQYVQPFIRLHDNGYDVQFLAGCYTYAYAYLIEPPAEPKYQPFGSIKEAMAEIKAHGWWIKDTIYNRCSAVIAYDDDTVKTVYDSVGVDALFDGFVFFDDGSPCGELVEE